jgi:glycosyltransferase involved in cell wall biosynthesis
VLLRKCLEAIVRLDPGADEILVVDNTAGDAKAEAVSRELGARYIVEASPGLSRARNRGLKESKSEIVAYVDDDAMPDVAWLGLLLEPFADPRVAAATGRIHITGYGPVGRMQDAPRVLNNKVPQWFEIATFGGLGLGSNMALRKTASGGRKLFDERLGRGAPFQSGEEYYAFALLLSQSYSAVYVPTAIVYHPPLSRRSVEQEACNCFTYWLLLFAEFPRNRGDLLRFLFRRLRRKPLTWARDPQGPGEIIGSGWRVKLKAALMGAILFLRTRKPRD